MYIHHAARTTSHTYAHVQMYVVNTHTRAHSMLNAAVGNVNTILVKAEKTRETRVFATEKLLIGRRCSDQQSSLLLPS